MRGFVRVLWMFWCVFALALVASAAIVPGSARAEIGSSTSLKASPANNPIKVCYNQTYALCALSSCFMFNDVAYCTCDIKKGKSIGESFSYGKKSNVCTVNAEGVDNGYMVSMYSLPAQIVAPKGKMAIYTCPGSTSSGAYAQCDGALCFRSTQGQNFPGSNKPLKPNQLICSCPVTVAAPPEPVGFQIAGPYPCQRDFFKYCDSKVANTNTGSTIYSGAPTGAARLLTKLLYGSAPKFNTCSLPD